MKPEREQLKPRYPVDNDPQWFLKSNLWEDHRKPLSRHWKIVFGVCALALLGAYVEGTTIWQYNAAQEERRQEQRLAAQLRIEKSRLDPEEQEFLTGLGF
jgi:hypothetical protein